MLEGKEQWTVVERKITVFSSVIFNLQFSLIVKANLILSIEITKKAKDERQLDK